MKKLLSFLFKAALCVAVLYIGVYAANNVLEKIDPWSGEAPEMLTEYGSPYKFYYERLSDKEKHAYNEILSHIYDMPESIRTPEINEEELRNVVLAYFELAQTFAWTPDEDHDFSYTLSGKTTEKSTESRNAYGVCY